MTPAKKTTTRRRSRPRRNHISDGDPIISHIRKALDLAEGDPERFRSQARKIAEKVGVSVEQVYQAVQRDPVARRQIENFVLQNATRLARRLLGL